MCETQQRLGLRIYLQKNKSVEHGALIYCTTLPTSIMKLQGFFLFYFMTTAHGGKIQSPTGSAYTSCAHLSDHPGYNLKRPRDFFSQTYGAYTLAVLIMAKACLSTTHRKVPPLSTGRVLWDHDKISSRSLTKVQYRASRGRLHQLPTESFTSDMDFQGRPRSQCDARYQAVPESRGWRQHCPEPVQNSIQVAREIYLQEPYDD